MMALPAHSEPPVVDRAEHCINVVDDEFFIGETMLAFTTGTVDVEGGPCGS